MGNVVAKLSNKHQAILDHLVTFPEHTQAQVARVFGVTPGWLSQIINSDMFQEALADKQEARFSRVVVPIEAKIAATAHAALDKISEKVSDCDDLSVLQNLAEMSLDRMGVGPSPGQASVNINVGTVAADVLVRARGNFANGNAVNAVQKTIPQQQGALIEQTSAAETPSVPPASNEV